MARRVFLHVGTMKSATSYLQKLMDVNRERLASHGVLWQTGQFNLYAFHEFNGSRRLPPEARGSWRRFLGELRAAPGDVVLSMELLARVPPAKARRIADALAAEDLQVVVTARDLTKVAPSHWQETTQNTGTTPFRAWVEEICDSDPEGEDPPAFWRNHYLPRIVESWRAASPSRIHVVTVPPTNADPTLVWRRFASVIGVPPEGFAEPGFTNPAIGAHSAELMRRLNERVGELPFQHYRRGFKAALAKQTLSRRAGQEPRPGLTEGQHTRLRSVALTMAEKVQQADVHVVGDIADIIPPEQPRQPPYDPATATDAELLEVALEGLASLGSRLGRFQADALRAEAEQQRPRDAGHRLRQLASMARSGVVRVRRKAG